MMKRLAVLLLALTLCLGLAGCGNNGGNGGDNAMKTSDQPVMLEYFTGSDLYGIINSEGTMIVPLAERDPNSIRILSYYEQQYYALEIESLYSEWAADEGLLSGQIFRFYDPWGQLVHEQQIDLPQLADGNSIEFWLARDGSLEHSRFLLNTFAGDGGYHILDVYGNELAAKQVFDLNEPLRFSSAVLEMDDEIMVANYTCYFEEQAEIEGAELYTLAGEPIVTDQGYQACWRGWNVATQKQTNYYVGRYTNEAGRYMYDLLDSRGQVLLSGFDELSYSMGDTMIVKRDGVRGLMNLQGEWLYQEPAAE